MENLQTSRPWRRKVNGSSMALGQGCADVLGAQSRHTAPLYVRLEDYSEIFAAAASACSIPVLDLSPVENGFEKAGRCGEVDYSDVFGSFGGRVFAGSFEELMAETKRSGVSSEEKRTRRDALFEQQEKEALEHHPLLYTEINESNLELNQHSSAPKQVDINAKQFGMSSCRMSRETIDKVSSDKTHGGPADAIPGYTFDDASNPIRQSKNKAANHGNVDTSGTKGYVSDAGQNHEATVCFFSTPKSFVSNIQANQTPIESSCASLLDPPGYEKKKSQSYSWPSASSGDIPMYVADYLNISEISLQTEPFVGPPPSREPPKLPAKTDHPNVFRTCSKTDVEEGRSLKNSVNNILLSRCEATQVNTTDETMKDIPFLRDAEMDPNSAAAVSMAAIKEAMELAQVRLTSAKKMMDRKHDINWRKIGQPKVMISKEDDTACGVDLKSCTQVINTNNLLKEGNMNSECLFVEREEIRSAGKVLSNYENKKLLLPSYINDEISKEDDMAYELEFKSCSQVIDANNLLKMSNANGNCTFVERKEIRPAGKTLLNTEDKKILLPSYIKDEYLMNQNASKSFEMAHNLAEIAGEWKMDKEYFKLIRNNKLLNTIESIYIQRNEKKSEAAICSCEGQETCSEDVKQSNKVKDCIENFEKGNELKGFCMDSMDVSSKNFVDATMDEYLVKSHGSEIEEAHCFIMPDENQKKIEAHNDNNKENMVTELGSVMDSCLYKENEIKLQNSSLDLNSGLANEFCEVKELKAVEGVSHYVECKKEFNVSRLKCEQNKSYEEMRVSNETHLHDLFDKEVKMPVELWKSNAYTKMELDEEVRPCYIDENETRIVKHQIEIWEIDNTQIEGEGNGLPLNFEAHVLVEKEIEQEAILDENGLEKPKRQECIADAELEHTLSSKERVYCKEYNEKETEDAQTALKKGEKLMEGDCKVPVELSTSNASDKELEEIRQSHTDGNEARIMKHLFEIQETDNISIKDLGDELKINLEVHPLVESVLEQEAIQVENGLENSKRQGKIEDAEHELTLNSRVGAHCKDYNEKETRDAQTAILEDENLTEGHMNSGFLASVEGMAYRSASEILAQDTLHNNVEYQICSNLADDVCQLSEVDAQGFLSAKESNLLPIDHDATEDSHAEMAGNHKQSFCTEMEENKRNISVDRDKVNVLETRSVEKEMEKKSERDRITVEREGHETCQLAIAEAQKRAERIAVERVIDEARERARAEALEKAERVAEAEKASREARLRAERVAVERATEEARKRAVEKALADKAAADTTERTAQASTSYKASFRKDNVTEHFKFTHFKASSRKDDRTENFKFPHSTVGSEARHKHSPPRTQWNPQSQSASFVNDHRYSNSHNSGGTDSNLRHDMRQERQQQTSERATKALSERSMLDVLAQREQAERDRMAESLNVEVRRWSNGKDGNLRALLSTLQYILGPDSGWQPIPITDIINVSSVKKAYRKATLCVHPDKLQQRGATIQQKYVCEKVFDLLQEAWSKFNSEER